MTSGINGPRENPLIKKSQSTATSKPKIQKENSQKSISSSAPFSVSNETNAVKIKKSVAAPSQSDHKTQKNIKESTGKMVGISTQEKKITSSNLDNDFLCDENTYQDALTLIQSFEEEIKEFDSAVYLAGPKGDPVANKKNMNLLNKAVDAVRNEARQLVGNGTAKDLQTAFKKIIGGIDRYDREVALHEKGSQTAPLSTYMMRTAVLKASHEEGAGLDTWTVYTKGGKPSGNDIWPFLENGKNWIPEAQGARAKWIEVSAVKTKALSKGHQESKAVFLKGGFGAGKTRLINQLFGELAGGAIAPDKAKEIDRRSNTHLPHSAAHLHGSQAAYELMNEMIQKQEGSVVYDSSLKNPSDISNYLASCKKAGKKLEVYDVARNDMARSLSVLKRSVGGEDPRIPPDFIINSAIIDKMRRVECMQVILNDKTEDPALKPVYHFISGDKQGWNTEEVMVLGPNRQIDLQQGAAERLALEGIEYDSSGNELKLTLNRTQLNDFFQKQFERPVREILAELSVEEQANLSIFNERIFKMDKSIRPILNAETLYQSLSQDVQAAIPLDSFDKALASLTEEARNQFFASIHSKSSFSYMDLPLRAALIINEKLKFDPWESK